MSLADRLQADMTTAMRDGDALTRDTLRMALAAAHNAEVAARRPLTDDEVVGVLSREAKTPPRVDRGVHEGRPHRPRRQGARGGRHPRRVPARSAVDEDELRALVARGHRRRRARPRHATWARSWAGSRPASRAAPTASRSRAWSPRSWPGSTSRPRRARRWRGRLAPDADARPPLQPPRSPSPGATPVASSSRASLLVVGLAVRARGLSGRSTGATRPTSAGSRAGSSCRCSWWAHCSAGSGGSGPACGIATAPLLLVAFAARRSTLLLARHRRPVGAALPRAHGRRAPCCSPCCSTRASRSYRSWPCSRSSAASVAGSAGARAPTSFLGGLAGHHRAPARRAPDPVRPGGRRPWPWSTWRWSRRSRCSMRPDLPGLAPAAGRGGRVGRRERRGRGRGHVRHRSATCSASRPRTSCMELANPSQPLLRRLLLEAPGTYHHSLMVGNLAERAAEAIGADPLAGARRGLLPRHRQAGRPHGVHREPAAGRPEPPRRADARGVGARSLAAHVANGIDIAYEYKLPKPVISFIPQHHGTGRMSYF